MNVVIQDPAAVQQLRAAQKVVLLTDSEGSVLGQFVPRNPYAAEPPISEEELQRLEQEPGRPLADILADLERKHGR